MSETWKDAARQYTHGTVLEVAANGDDTYEIIFNQKVVGSRIPESWLDDELCAKPPELRTKRPAHRRQSWQAAERNAAAGGDAIAAQQLPEARAPPLSP